MGGSTSPPSPALTVTVDTTGPTMDILDVAPDPRNTGVDAVTIVFNEPVAGFDLADLALTRDGAAVLLTGARRSTTGDGLTWTLGNLAGPTGTAGSYVLGLRRPARGSPTLAGNALAADDTDAFVVDTTPPTADVVDVTPDPRNGAVDSITIVFSEPVSGFDLADLALTRDGGANLLTGRPDAAPPPTAVTWTLGNLAGLTDVTGSYVLTLTAAGSGIADAAGNALAADASDTFDVDSTPTVDDPRRARPAHIPVGTITIVFSEPVIGFDLADLALTARRRRPTC